MKRPHTIPTRTATLFPYTTVFRSADGRHVLRARPGGLLYLLRGRADSDVPHHRHLGRRAARLRGLQVLPLYARRLGADAAGDPRHVLRCRHHRHSDPAGPSLPGPDADLAVARLLRLLRGEGADVAGA